MPRVAVLAQKLGGLEPVHPRHVDIQQDDGELSLEHALQRLLARAGHDDFGVHALEGRPVGQALLGQVIHDQDPCSRRRGGAWLRGRIRIAAA